jgi:alpha-beta hydrolase superfamily lysophospholipase
MMKPLAILVAALSLQLLGAQEASTTRADFLRLIDRPRVAPAPSVTSMPAAGRYAREHFTFVSEAGERVPGITLKRTSPDAAARRPAVIVLHGTGDSKEGMIPLLGELAGRGFLAVAIDGRYHGERESGPGDYDAAILRAYRGGGSHPLLYDTAWDAMRLVDYLQTRSDVDPARIGMLGISKGGMETYLAAAVDPRIVVAVPVIAAQSFRWALEHNAWPARVGTFQSAVTGAARTAGLNRIDAGFVRTFYDRVVPGIYGEFDGPAVLPLIAPRPLLVINGDSDSLTPLPGVQECVSASERAYKAAGAPEKFRFLLQPDAGHELTRDGERAAIEWFVRWLTP